MGNFHAIIDRYLKRTGFKVITRYVVVILILIGRDRPGNERFLFRENTIKLLSFKCLICGTMQASSTALKTHLATKHFR